MKRRIFSLVMVLMFAFSLSAVAADKKYRWKMIETWTTGIPFHNVAQHFCDTVDEITDGQLTIKLFPAGAIVPAFEVFDAVRNGVAEMGHDWSGYWKGKDQAFVAFASVPFGFDAMDYTMWFYGADGMELANELYAEYGLIPFPTGNTGQELGFFTKKPVNEISDMEGMKVRTVGWAADILTQLGVSVSPMPGGEVYLALERGVIDSAEFSSPSITLPMGFHEVAKNVVEPGWHQPSVQLMSMVNKKAYDKLPKHLQKAIEVAAKETQVWSMGYFEAKNAEAIREYKKAGVNFTKLSEDSLNELAKTSKAYLDGLRKKHPYLDKVLASQENFKADFANWRDLRSGLAAWPYDQYIDGKHFQ
ncbi:TRAP transporter substrate-binding protein [Limisalsivibrio acetivorans]|uniref:TRAP transporter substrate-binding protein n=1 Tax=Limisalsivibrio acetivorans TaxID=1304888 RepID=UPI0003B47B20|nr:TRAP transporter substrate-binding protein DctP [Limisalsivibrio acetivorans]